MRSQIPKNLYLKTEIGGVVKYPIILDEMPVYLGFASENLTTVPESHNTWMETDFH